MGILLLLAFALWFFWGRQPAPVAHIPSAPESPAPRALSLPAVGDDRGKRVEALLNRNRMAIGQCLMHSERDRIAAVQLTLQWDSLGNPTRVALAPDLGESAKRCLTQLTHSWSLPPASDLKPFSVMKKLLIRLQ